MRRALVLFLLTGLAATPAAAAPTPAAEARPCAAPQHRQLDFWIGDWDLVIRVRRGPEADTWLQARGTQHIEPILGGCAISETFSADGPGDPWAGRSYSMWVPALGKWRQTWVDDQGEYLAFTGGVEHGVMTLVGEPRHKNGRTLRMRMVFLDVKPDSLRWEWQRDTGHSRWRPMMVIEYRRRH